MSSAHDVIVIGNYRFASLYPATRYKILEKVANGTGLVIGNQAGGMPGAFSAGADLVMMSDLAKEKDYALLETAS